MSDDQSAGYVMVPVTLLNATDLTDKQKLLGARIIGLVKANGYAYAGNPYLARVMGCTIPSVSRMLRALSDGGYIKIFIDKKAGNKRRIYLTEKLLIVGRIAINAKGNTPITPTGNQNNRSRVNNKKKNKNAREQMIPFTVFWNTYDKKVGKKVCETKWNRLPIATQREILNHLKGYIAATPDRQFRKNPATYLNQETWKDEHLPTRPKDRKAEERATDMLTTKQHYMTEEEYYAQFNT